MNQSIYSDIADNNATVLSVWYTGTDALKRGEGVCFAEDSASKAERPSQSNNMRFAGVVRQDHTASTTGQMIEIMAPGSQCEVALGADVAVGDRITCSAGAGDAGRWTLEGLPGQGSALVIEAKTAVVTSQLDGTGSLATDGVTLTVSDSTGVAAGDLVYFVGTEDEDGAGKSITLGAYTVASVTSGTVIVLSASAVSVTPGAALLNSFYIVSGNPRGKVVLDDGAQSGLQEIVSPPNVGHASAVSFTVMPGGITYINGGVTIATANARATLADGAFEGQVKGLKCLGAITTNDAEIELATDGQQQKVDGTTGVPLVMHAITFDAAAEIATIVWYGVWQEVVHVGAAIAAS